jgi:hypothetical protein
VAFDMNESETAADMTSLLTLGLVPSLRPGRVLDGGGRHAERSFLDFRVGDWLLGPLVATRVRLVDLANDYVSVLVTNWPAGFPAQAVMQLLGMEEPPLPDGRTPLYLCAECGGLGCGAVTAVIERDDDGVTWHSLGRQTDYDSFVDYEPFKDLGPYRFHITSYEATLRGLLAARIQP